MSWKKHKKIKQLIQEEISLIPTKSFGSVPINVALVYPNSYELGMSNLGFHSIYKEINIRDDALCHRAFAFYDKDITFSQTLEALKPLNEYDLIAFSISFELDYLNVIKVLDEAGIPVFSKKRERPLIMAGGPAVTFNPEPLTPFIDFFVIGEGEEVIHEIISKYQLYCSKNKIDILSYLATIKGVYVPEFYDFNYGERGEVIAKKTKKIAPDYVKKRWIKNLDKYNTESVIITKNTEFKDMFLLEVSRGCGRNCRFCMAGYCYKIPRIRSLNKLVERAKWGSQYKKKIGLVGAAISDYPFIDELSKILKDLNIKFSVSSLRADSLKPSLLDSLSSSGHKTLTIAPEAGSERLRNVINKQITEDDVVNAIKLAHEYKIKNIKLYYIIGLPTETDDDIDEMIEFLYEIKDYMKQIGNKTGQISVSVNPFIPKPFTPFQWIGMESIKSLNKKIKKLRNLLRPKGIKVTAESPRLSQIQSALSRGDRRTGQLLFDVYKKGDSNSAYRKAQVNGNDIEFYAHRRFRSTDILPWEHIDIGIKKDYFLKEMKRAEQGIIIPRCTSEKCSNCRICDKN